MTVYDDKKPDEASEKKTQKSSTRKSATHSAASPSPPSSPPQDEGYSWFRYFTQYYQDTDEMDPLAENESPTGETPLYEKPDVVQGMEERWADVIKKYTDIFTELKSDAASRQHPAFGIFEDLLDGMKAAFLKWRARVRLGKSTVAALSLEGNITLSHFEQQFSLLGGSPQSDDSTNNNPKAAQNISDPYDALTPGQAVLRWRKENTPGQEGEANKAHTMPNIMTQEQGREFRELSVVQKALFGIRLGLGVAELKPDLSHNVAPPIVAAPPRGERFNKFGMRLYAEFIKKMPDLSNLYASQSGAGSGALSPSQGGSWFGVAASPVPKPATRFVLVPSESQETSGAQENAVIDNLVADSARVKLSGTLQVNQYENFKETLNDEAYSLPADAFMDALRKVHGAELKNNPEVSLPLLPDENNATEVVVAGHNLPLNDFLQLPYDRYSAAHYKEYPVTYPASFSAALIKTIDRYRQSVEATDEGAEKVTPGIEDLDVLLKNSQFVESLLKFSRVETKRRDTYQWIAGNKIAATSMPRQKKMEAIKYGMGTAQLNQEFKGQEKDITYDEIAQILSRENIALDTQQKFNDFKNGLGQFIPVNDMLHLPETEVAKNLASQFGDVSTEDIIEAIKASKPGNERLTLPPDVSANSTLLREINIYTHATAWQKSSSQRTYDNYLLAAIEKYTDPEKAMEEITRQRIDKSSISLTHQKYSRPTVDTPVRLKLEHVSWLDNKNPMFMLHKLIFAESDTIETTLSGLVSGSWRTEHMAKLGFLAKIINPLAHYTPVIKEAFLNGTKTLTPQEVNILTEEIDEKAFEFESFSFYIDKEINEVMQRGKTRLGIQAAGAVKEKIQLGIAPESIYEESGNVAANKILISLLNGEPVEHTTIIAKSKTGKIVIPDIVLLPINEANSVIFSLKTAEVVFITAETLSKLYDHSMTDQLPRKVFHFLISHMDPKQLQDATVKNKNNMEQLIQDYKDEQAQRNRGHGGRINLVRTTHQWHRMATRANLIKHALQEGYKYHKDYDKYRNIIGAMTHSPEDFKKALFLYANLYPDEGKEIIVRTGARRLRNQPLIETVSDNLFGNMFSGFRTFDTQAQNQAELSQEQWQETGWFLLSLALGAATGFTVGAAGVILQFSQKTIWVLQTLASAGVSGAEELLKANAQTNEEKRKAAFAGIKYEVIFSLLADVGMDKMLMPVVKKMVKKIRNGLNPSALKPVVEGLNAIKGKNLREFSQHFDQSSSVDKIEILTEKIMETDEVFRQLQTTSADKMRQRIKEIIKRNPHRLEEGGFVNAYSDVLEKLKPLTNQGVAKSFKAMDTYAKIAYLKDYSIHSTSGRDLATELGPQGAALVKKLVDDRLSLNSLGRSRSAFHWQTEKMHKGTLDVELKIESRRLRNIKGTLALMAEESPLPRTPRKINIVSASKRIRHWIQTTVEGMESSHLSPDFVESTIQRYIAIDMTHGRNLNRLYQEIYHPETPTLNRYMGDNVFLSNKAGMEGYRQWLKTIDTSRSDFPLLNLNAMTMFQPFADANGIMARLIYGINLLQRGYRFKPVDIADYHPDNLIVPYNRYNQAPPNIDYRKGKKISTDIASTVYQYDRNKFAKDYNVNHDAHYGSINDIEVFYKAEQNKELLNRYYQPGFARLYRYFENGLQKISVTFSKAPGQSFDNIVKNYVASTKSKALFSELSEADIDTVVKNSLEAMKKLNVFHPDITTFNANFNRNKKTILVTNFDGAEVNSPGTPMPQVKLDIMAYIFRDLFNQAKERSVILRNQQLGNKQTKNSLRSAFSNIKANYVNSKIKNHEFNAQEFNRGVKDFKSDADKTIAQVETLLPDNYLELDDITLINLYNRITTETTEHGTISHYQRGILFEIINQRKNTFVRRETISAALHGSKSRKKIINKNARYVMDLDQESLLASVDMHYTNGLCLPMSYVGIVALANDIEKPWAKNYSNILKSNNPRKGARDSSKLEQGKAYMEAHNKIYLQKVDDAFQKDLGELKISEIIDKLEQCKQSSFFLLQTKSHAMTVAVKINKNNEKLFYFIDPSVSMAEYTKSKYMLDALEGTIGKKMVETDLGPVAPQFRLIEITNTKGLGDTPIQGTHNPKLSFMDLADVGNRRQASLVSSMDLDATPVHAQVDPEFGVAKTNLIQAIRENEVLQTLMKNPLEKCRDATQKTLEITRKMGISSEVIQLLSWNRKLDAAINHYALQIEVNGKKYVLDTTFTQDAYFQSKILNNEITGAGQEVFDQKVYMGPAQAWFKLMKEGEENALLKVQISKEGGLLRDPSFAIGAPYDVPGLTLNQPDWFKRKMGREALYNDMLLKVRADRQVAADVKLLPELAKINVDDYDLFFNLGQGKTNFLGMRNRQALSRDLGLNKIVPFKPRNADDLATVLDNFDNINEDVFSKMSANAKDRALNTLSTSIKTHLIARINGNYKYDLTTRVELAKLLAEIEAVQKRVMYKEYNYADPFGKNDDLPSAQNPSRHNAPAASHSRGMDNPSADEKTLLTDKYQKVPITHPEGFDVYADKTPLHGQSELLYWDADNQSIKSFGIGEVKKGVWQRISGAGRNLFSSSKHRDAKKFLDEHIALYSKPESALTAKENEQLLDKLVKLVSEGDNKGESQAVADYNEAGSAKINEALRGQVETKKSKAFMAEFERLNNYEGVSYRVAFVTPQGADALKTGRNKVFYDRGVQSASVMPTNARQWASDGFVTEGRAGNEVPVVYIFDESVNQKILSNSFFPDHVAVKPNAYLELRAVRNVKGQLYVYFSSPTKVPDNIYNLYDGVRESI